MREVEKNWCGVIWFHSRESREFERCYHNFLFQNNTSDSELEINFYCCQQTTNLNEHLKMGWKSPEAFNELFACLKYPTSLPAPKHKKKSNSHMPELYIKWEIYYVMRFWNHGLACWWKWEKYFFSLLCCFLCLQQSLIKISNFILFWAFYQHVLNAKE